MCIVMLLTGCARTSYNVATHHQEVTFTSTDKEVEMGRKLAQKVRSELKLAVDEPMQERVRAIGQKVAAVSDRHDLVYSFEVVKDDGVNAFSLPGGYVFVNEGLVKKAASDDELAAVLAHEVGHVAARHSIKRYETGIGASIAQIAGVVASRRSPDSRGIGVALQAALLAYARQDELDADRLGVKYMRAAGYDPKAMLSFLEKLHKVDQDKLQYMPRGIVRPYYAMTHPYVSDRVRAVKEELYGVADYIDYLNSPN